MSLEEKYLDLSEDEIDNLLYGLNLDKKLDITDDKECISCKSNKLIIDSAKGYLVCEDCAVINEEFLDKNYEFNSDINGTTRYGCPSNYFYPKSALGTKLTSKCFNRLSAIHRQGQMPYKEKSLMQVLEERIQNKCKKYIITQSIIDTSKILYKKISESKHTKGKRKGKNMIMRCINRRSMIAACVFHACKLQDEPRSPKEIADIYDLEIKYVNKGCRKLLDYIDINSIFAEIRSSESSDFIERFSKKLNIEQQYIDKAKDIARNINKLGLITKHLPPSVAAGSILLIEMIYHLDIPKKLISEIFGISDVTISKTFKKIKKYQQIITNNEITNLVVEKKNNIPKQNLLLNENNLIITDKSTESESDMYLKSYTESDTEYNVKSEESESEESESEESEVKLKSKLKLKNKNIKIKF